MKTLLLPVLLLCLALPAAANAATWFEVEVLAFSRDDQSSERWPDDTVPLSARRGIDLLSPLWLPDTAAIYQAANGCNSTQWLQDPEGCRQKEQANQPPLPTQLPLVAAAKTLGNPAKGEAYLLPESMLQLGPQARQLARNGHTLLLHTGWQMPVYSRRSASPVLLFGGRNFSETFEFDGRIKKRSETEEASQPSYFSSEILEPEMAVPVWQLNGWLNIYLDRYLFIEARLDLREPGERQWEREENEVSELIQADSADDLDAADTPRASEPYLFTIRMDQNRRARSREIHYFDHPKMGLVVQIRRMAQPGE
ncbi:CsiV family protein [Ferrimonas gelatinilytica]|uniref:Peptidoglycan binding protein CsiV n=1 Tax=Ferrimonas gelatinilytica TaxID=1255257 RepID=A0ABP9RZI0_9GAMM